MIPLYRMHTVQSVSIHTVLFWLHSPAYWWLCDEYKYNMENMQCLGKQAETQKCTMFSKNARLRQLCALAKIR